MRTHTFVELSVGVAIEIFNWGVHFKGLEQEWKLLWFYSLHRSNVKQNYNNVVCRLHVQYLFCHIFML